MLVFLSFAGTAVFAVSGALLALRHRMDVIGVLFLAGVTGLGGGTMRDLLLGRVPVSWVSDPSLLGVCGLAALLVSLLNPWLDGRRLKGLIYADAAGMATFAVLGTSTALSAGAHPAVAVLFGAMSAAFGGIIRDVICQEPPVVFRGQIYVSAALLAGTVYALLSGVTGGDLATWLGVGSGLALRLLAIQFDWSLPFPRYR